MCDEVSTYDRPKTRRLPHELITNCRAKPGGIQRPARRRWMRVFFSSLRCFFFAILLRRFLMTDPTLILSRISEYFRCNELRRAQIHLSCGSTAT